MMFDPETDIVTVLATWLTVAAYKRLSESVEFQRAMGSFGVLFAAPPEISINELLVEMAP